MAKVSRSREMNVPAAEMWKKIGDYHGLHTWHPFIESSTPGDDEKVRTLKTPDGGVLVETLVDQGDNFYTYRIEESPFPFKDLVSTIRVREAGARCVRR